MGNKKIEKMYEEMKEQIYIICSLHNRKVLYVEWLDAQNRIDEIKNKYMETLSGLLLFEVITEKTHEYGYKLLENLEYKLNY